MKKYLLFVIFLALAVILVFKPTVNYFKSRQAAEKLMPSTDFSGETNPEVKTLEGDLLGKGYKQKVIVSVGERKVKIEVYDNGKLVASNVFSDGFVKPTMNYELIKLNKNISREYIRWDQYVGPHEKETHILTTKDSIVRPVFSADYDNKQWYAPFWSSRGETYIGDIDADGVAEIIEFVDEFPPEAPRLVDSEIEKITRREFPDDKKDDMWKIVSRENSGIGRGRKVIWNVYTRRNQDPLLFQKSNKEEYEKLTSNIIKAMKQVNETNQGTEQLISKYDLTQDSIDFNNFVRNFWTQGYPYAQPFDDMK